MPVIAFSIPKGGAGKSTSACILGSILAEQGATVTMIDADPNRIVQDWANLAALPPTLTVISDVEEETIIDRIEDAAAESAFVIVDLEGAATLMAVHAISMADLVIIPVQGSQLDAKQAARQIGLVRSQEKVTRRPIPYAVLVTRTNPALMPNTLKHVLQSFEEANIPVMSTRLYEREAFKAMFSFGGTLSNLKDRGVSNLPAAINNAAEFASEVVQRLREHRDSQKKEVA